MAEDKERLVAYIKSQLSAGVTPDTLRKRLVSSGHDPELVDEILSGKPPKRALPYKRVLLVIILLLGLTTVFLIATRPATPQAQRTYAIQPVIFLAVDTNIDVGPYQAQVDRSFAAVQDWYKAQLGGKTFNLSPAIVHRSSLTDSQLHSRFGSGEGIWVEGLKEATRANGLDVCDDHRFYYFVTPLDNITGGFVGAEHLGCGYVLAGTASIPSHMGRLIGGIIDTNWPEEFADETREAQGGVAHEIGHGLGGSCTRGNYPGGGCDGLPHPDSGQHSVIYEWWEFGTTGILLENEKTQILKSPFIS